MTIARLAERIRAGELSPREAVQASLGRIEVAAGLNAFISVRAEEALAEAETAPAGPLHGVPVAIKDVIDVAGARTTAGSEILRDNVAGRDAETVARLRAAGAVVVGKLNTHEFAFGATTTSPHFGPAHNPWARDRICGGSSGGSGAAVAADLVPGALGTDTAGSIRIPACYCGVTGLRPSTGLVSNAGVVPTSWRFDTVGPLARTAEDCSLLLEALAPSYRPELGGGVAGLRIGVVDALFDQADPEIAARARSAVDALRSLGARVEPVVVPLLAEAGTIVQTMMLPEAAQAHLGWLRTRLADYGPDVRARLLAGLLLPSTAYVTGLRAQRLYLSELQPLLERYDLLVQPAMPVLPPLIGDETVVLRGETIPYRLALIPFNSPWTLAGAPVASVPCGFVEGLPVGLALVGRPEGEATVLRAAAAFQRATDWHEHRPEHAGEDSFDGSGVRRRFQLLLGVALVLLAGGVAAGIALAFRSGGGSSLTPAQYLARADATCRLYARQLDRIAPPDPGSTTDVAASVGRALPVLEKQADAVRKIRPPRELEQRVRRFFTLTDRSLAALGTVLDAARKDDAKAMGPRLGAWFKASGDAQTASKRVGFHC